MSNLVRVTVASLLMILSIVSFADAEADLANYLSQKIYSDCSGQDIRISEAFFRKDIKGYETALNLSTHQNNSYLVKSNLTLDELNEITTILTNNEPFNLYAGEDIFTSPEDVGPLINGRDGRNILYCGNKSLTIHLMTYYWNGKRIDPFVIINQTIENITQRVDKIENYYTNVSGQSNLAVGQGSSAKSEERTLNIASIPITTNEVSISLFGGVFGGLFGGGLSVYIIFWWKNRKSKGK